ncbi:pentapeptide repeat-containing protein [Nostoc sp. FACHB-973]|nr:pentapeptide repeat-containing protein [Nostoc sp. FACHB-973]
MNSDDLNFCNQNLRNRSFAGLQLNDANFSGADVRGCNFSNAQLQRANFVRAKFGQSPRVFISLRITAFIVLFVVFPAISEMGFGVLGNTPEIPAWSYTQALVVSLAISGLGTGLRRIFAEKSKLENIMTTISGVASAALIGFYYGGIIQNNNPQVAVISAFIASIFGAILCLIFRNGLMRVTVAVAGFICSYGLAFLISSVAFAYLSTQNYLFGSIWGILTLILLALTMRSLNLAVQEITTTGITKFRGANLENARFDSDLNQKAVDFTGAIARNTP